MNNVLKIITDKDDKKAYDKVKEIIDKSKTTDELNLLICQNIVNQCGH